MPEFYMTFARKKYFPIWGERPSPRKKFTKYFLQMPHPIFLITDAYMFWCFFLFYQMNDYSSVINL